MIRKEGSRSGTTRGRNITQDSNIKLTKLEFWSLSIIKVCTHIDELNSKQKAAALGCPKSTERSNIQDNSEISFIAHAIYFFFLWSMMYVLVTTCVHGLLKYEA